MIRYLFVLLISVGLLGCSKSIPDEPEVTFENNNVLKPRFAFQTTDDLAVYVEYWNRNGGSKSKSKTSQGKVHAIGLLNLTEETEYNYVIRSADGKVMSDEYMFRTGKIPESVLIVEKELIDTTIFSGYILVRRYYKSGADVILNNKGDIVWYNLYDTAIRRPFHWTSNNTILSIYDTSRIVEIDLHGNKIIDIDLERPNEKQFVHHEIFYDRDGSIVTLTTDSILYDARPFGGSKDQSIWGAGIIKISTSGNILWKWSLLDHINLNEFIPQLNGIFEARIGHANSVAVTEDGKYLVSLRDFNQIWKIDPVSGSVIWKLGKGGDVKMDTVNYFLGQHSIHFNKAGELVMFDNGHSKFRPFSRVLSLTVDESRKEAKANFIINLPKELSSFRMCSAYEIDTDKLLICTSRQYAFIGIINKAGDILWKVKADNSSYRAYYIENPFIGQ